MWLPRTSRTLQEWLPIESSALVDDACVMAIGRVQELERKVADLYALAHPETSNIPDRDV